ncbi:MAG TPA: diacylglycerol kinase family lipid kinase [Chloroflexi bacterium]|jgi:diacylglycerol kinase (ATP)|nr:diacylglycerol kinase family lipid kinase [Chloroflexota bacterium]
MDRRDAPRYSEAMKAMMIYNPVAGQRDMADELRQVIAYLEGQRWEVTLRRTLGPGDATTYAREAVVHGFDMAIAVGGDGTLGQVATGLAGSRCILGVLPVGTGNVWAHMLGLPQWSPLSPRTTLLDAARVLVEGEVHAVDLGMAGDRYFMLWAGIGFDAQVTRGVEPHREIRRSLGNLTYVIATIALSLGLRGTRVTVTIDGRSMRQRLIMAVVSNAQLYGPTVRLAPQAQIDDGELDVYLFKGDNLLDGVRHLASVLVGRHHRNPKVAIYRARHVALHAARPLPVHLDGEPIGYTPVSISVAPRALRVIVPSWASGSLFTDGGGAEEASLARRIAERLRAQRERWHEEAERLQQDWERVIGRSG